MNKYIYCILIGCSILLTSCGTNSNSTDSIINTHNIQSTNASYIIANNDSMYFSFQSCIYELNDNNISICCDNPLCEHMNLLCSAYIDGGYFELDGQLYKYENYDSHDNNFKSYIYQIKNNQEDIVYEHSYPEDISTELKVEASLNITVCKISDEYILICGDRFRYLADKNFDIIHTYYDSSPYYTATIYNNHFYYIDNLHNLVSVNLNTKDVDIINIGSQYVLEPTFNNTTLVYLDEQNYIYIYSLIDNTNVKLTECDSNYSFVDNNIYYMYDNQLICIDTKGNFVFKTSHPDLISANVIKWHDRLYFYNLDHFLSCNTDGTNFTKIIIDDY